MLREGGVVEHPLWLGTSIRHGGDRGDTGVICTGVAIQPHVGVGVRGAVAVLVLGHIPVGVTLNYRVCIGIYPVEGKDRIASHRPHDVLAVVDIAVAVAVLVRAVPVDEKDLAVSAVRVMDVNLPRFDICDQE